MKSRTVKTLVDSIVAALGIPISVSATTADAPHSLRISDVDQSAAVTLPVALNDGLRNMYAGHRSHSSHSSHVSHSSHYSGSSGSSPPSSTPSTSGSDASAATPFVAPRPTSDQLKMMIMRVQAGLYSRGYDPGAIDGVLSEQTQLAIRRYQTDKHLSVSGSMTTELLNSLGIRAQ